jgi:hypothetical protein
MTGFKENTTLYLLLYFFSLFIPDFLLSKFRVTWLSHPERPLFMTCGSNDDMSYLDIELELIL